MTDTGRPTNTLSIHRSLDYAFRHTIPDEIVLLILSFLPPRTLLSLRLLQPSSSLSSIAISDHLWNSEYERLFKRWSPHFDGIRNLRKILKEKLESEDEERSSSPSSRHVVPPLGQFSSSVNFHRLELLGKLVFPPQKIQFDRKAIASCFVGGDNEEEGEEHNQQQQQQELYFDTEELGQISRNGWYRQPQHPNTTTSVLKLSVIGDGSVGKTTLLQRLRHNLGLIQQLSPVYVPTLLEEQRMMVIEEESNSFSSSSAKIMTKLKIVDTAGQSDYDPLRPMMMSNSTAVLICFDVTRRSSTFTNVKQKWIHEATQYASPDAVIILCATKLDLMVGDSFSHDEETEEESEQWERNCRRRWANTDSGHERDDVSIAEAREFAARNPKISFFVATSARDGRGVDLIVPLAVCGSLWKRYQNSVKFQRRHKNKCNVM